MANFTNSTHLNVYIYSVGSEIFRCRYFCQFYEIEKWSGLHLNANVTMTSGYMIGSAWDLNEFSRAVESLSFTLKPWLKIRFVFILIGMCYKIDPWPHTWKITESVRFHWVVKLKSCTLYWKLQEFLSSISKYVQQIKLLQITI